jgi:hypothetical protein
MPTIKALRIWKTFFHHILANIEMSLETGVIAPNNFTLGTNSPKNRATCEEYHLALARCHGNAIIEDDHFEKIVKRKLEAILEIETLHPR